MNVATCVPLPDDVADGPLSLTAFRGELDSAVSQYISQVKDLGYKEEGTKDQKLLAVKFQLDPDDIKPRSEEDVIETEPKIKVISTEDKGEQTELEVELPSLDNPLYLTLSECTSGLFPYSEEDLALEHLYENGHVGREDEHIYENVESSTGEEEEEHLYDSLPRHRPDLPPKPDFLSQLAARQSEPVKRAWNPFVSLSVDTGNPTPPLSTISSLSSPDSNTSNDHSEENLQKPEENSIILSSKPTETSGHTLILDGSETSDLGSSGGEYDVGSVEDWPLPPTPPLGEEEVLLEDNPLPPPPPELALQQLEEEVFREKEEERKLALQRARETIERDYGVKTQDLEVKEHVEAVNTTLASLGEKFKEPPKSEKATKEPEPEKVPKVLELDEDDTKDFDTPAIRHSVIIALKDSCPSVPKSIRPSDIRRKENLKRSESLKHTGVLRRSNSHNRVNRRESICSLFPSIINEFKKTENSGSVSLGVTSPKKEEPSFSFLDPVSSKTNQVIEISEDGSWETKHPSTDSKSSSQSNKADTDPITGNPIMTPPLSPAAIAAPPTEFQTNDGVDGVYSANVISTYSGPSSLTSTATDSISAGDGAPAEIPTPSLLTAPEIIHEEPSSSQDVEVVECYNEASDMASASLTTAIQAMSPAHKNLGAAIMESYEMEFRKKKESMNLPEHSLLEFGDSVRALEEQRRSVIKQMTVKAKRKDTWIKTFNMHDKGKEDNIPVAPSRAKRRSSPTRPEMDAKPVVSSQDTTDSSINGLAQKSETEFVKSQKSTLENSTLLKSSLMVTMAPAEVEPVVAHPKVSRKNKEPEEPEPVAVATTRSENYHSITDEGAISLQFKETLCPYSSPPTGLAKDIMEHNISHQDITKIDGDNPEEVVVSPEVPEVPAVVPIAVEGLVSPALLEAPPVTNSGPEASPAAPIEPVVDTSGTQFPADTKESPESEEHDLSPKEPIEAQEQSNTETEEDAMVREKNEINLVHSAMAKYLSNELDGETDKTKEVKVEETKHIEVASPEAEADAPDRTAIDADPQEDEGRGILILVLLLKLFIFFASIWTMSVCKMCLDYILDLN